MNKDWVDVDTRPSEALRASSAVVALYARESGWRDVVLAGITDTLHAPMPSLVPPFFVAVEVVGPVGSHRVAISITQQSPFLPIWGKDIVVEIENAAPVWTLFPCEYVPFENFGAHEMRVACKERPLACRPLHLIQRKKPNFGHTYGPWTSSGPVSWDGPDKDAKDGTDEPSK
jgi:hypothetical protein